MSILDNKPITDNRKPAISPAPWKLSDGNCGAIFGIMSAENWPVCLLGRKDAVKPADAALLVAAPELLQSLNDMLAIAHKFDLTGRNHEVDEAIRRAIAVSKKAGGLL